MVPTSMQVIGAVTNARSSPSMWAETRVATRNIMERPELKIAWPVASTATFILAEENAMTRRL